jgi:demethylmenaquinone methyltransferase/2-methoxy-6-polyprenyl-1,4-benzoquinol methylase
MENPSQMMPVQNITEQWFRDWSNEYDRTLGKMKRHHALLDLAVGISFVHDGDRVLDVGCGTGLLSLKFLEKADCRVTGVDVSPEMLAVFLNKIELLSLQSKIDCLPGDAASLRFPDRSFDVVASTVTLHHVLDKAPMIKKIHSILKPGGHFVLGDVDLDTTGDFNDVRRLKRILAFLGDEWTQALKDAGIDAFKRMYDNGKKHIFNEGEYCVSFRQWKDLCLKAGFGRIVIRPVARSSWFKVLVAVK